jgi:hypothetical protein
MEGSAQARATEAQLSIFDLWSQKNDELFSRISDPGFDPHTPVSDSNGRTLLHMAADRASTFDVEVCQRLLALQDIRVDHDDKFDRSALALCWYARIHF